LLKFARTQRAVFDEAAAVEAARAYSEAERVGRPLGVVDAQIIGVAISTRCAVATRDLDFADRGVSLVNPWRE
jgi:predicted nucleic acid-binding protein